MNIYSKYLLHVKEESLCTVFHGDFNIFAVSVTVPHFRSVGYDLKTQERVTLKTWEIVPLRNLSYLTIGQTLFR